MSRRPTGDAALDRLIADPRRVSALRAEYDGRHELADALWWRRHPLSTTPRGVPDPALARDALRRAAFGRESTRRDTGRLRDFEDALEADAAALDALLARAAREEQRPDERGPSEHGLDGRGLDGRGGDAQVEKADVQLPRGRARPVLLGAAALVAVAVLAASTVVLSVRLAEAESVAAGVAPAEGGDPLDRLDRPQDDDDVPRATLPYDYDLLSVRRLLRPDQTGLADDYVLYGARDENDGVCLIVAFPDERIAASCVSLAELRQNGLRVSTNVYRSSRASLGSEVLVSHTVTWRPDDTFEFSSSPADGRR